MMYSGILLACNILAEQLSVLLPFFSIFHKDWRFTPGKLTGILCGYLFFVCLLSLSAFHLFNEGSFLRLTITCLSMVSGVFLCNCLAKVNLQVIIYALFLFRNFTDSAILFSDLMAFVTGIDETLYSHGSAELLFQLLFLLLVCESAHRLYSPYLAEAVEYTRPLPVWNYLTAIPVIFFSIFRMEISDILPTQVLERKPELLVLAALWLVCIFTVHYVSLRILARLAQSYAIREQFRTVRLLTSVQTSQMASLQNNLEQLIKLRHDFLHHCITIKGLLEANNTDAAMEYIDNYLKSKTYTTTTRYCSNLSANSLLNYYLQTAKELSFHVKTDISLPEVLPLPDVDFCTILGNLLSNALEACERQDSGTPCISVSIRQTGTSMITLLISNTYTHEIRKQDDRFISSKRNEPGIGTVSVRYLVERYHGILKYNYGNGIFEVYILLNPQMGKEDPSV